MGKPRDIADSAAVINALDGIDSTGIDITGTVTADGLSIDGGTTNRVASFISTDASALIEFADDTTTNRPAIGAQGNDMTFSTNGEKVRIDSSGNVGIGTISPTESLMVSGSGSQYIRLQSTDGSGSGVYLGNNGSSDRRITLDNANLKFENNDGTAEYMRIDSSGNVGVGTTSPSTALDVSGTVTATTFSGSGASLTSLSASNISSGTLAVARGGTGSTTSSGAASNLGLGTSNSVQHGSLGVGTGASGTSGEIRATNNITAYYSDERLKTKLGDISDALYKVESLSGFYYEANEVAQALGYEAHKEVGVSAQEVQAVMPEAVAPAPIDDKYLTVRYEKLVPLLIEAIKELSQKVADLEAK